MYVASRVVLSRSGVENQELCYSMWLANVIIIFIIITVIIIIIIIIIITIINWAGKSQYSTPTYCTSCFVIPIIIKTASEQENNDRFRAS